VCETGQKLRIPLLSAVSPELIPQAGLTCLTYHKKVMPNPSIFWQYHSYWTTHSCIAAINIKTVI